MPKPLAVLIVEDSESDAQLIVRMLTKAGYTLMFERVETTAQMRAALEKRTWEIVISDFSMPELDGYGALKVLQETGLDIPFIVVSGTMGEETAVTMMKAGAHDYVMKGNLPRLVPAVERELTQAEVRRERKQAEETLKISKERLLFATEGANLGIWYWDTVTGELVWSNQCKVLFGIGLDETMSYQRFSDALHPGDRERTDMAVKDALDNHKDYDIEFRSLWSDGSIHWLAAKGRGYYNATGKAVRLEGVVLDITERKQAEQKLQEYSEHLEELVEERTRELRDAQEKLVRQEKLAVLGQLAGGVSHELRNPLGVINSAIYYLKMVQPDADDKVRQYHAMIEEEAQNIEKILNDMLGFARGFPADREPVAVPALVERVLEHHPAPSSVDVALSLPANLPKVYADSRQMGQVLGNLVLNACQAMPNGGKLTITAHRQKEVVAIAIKDTGTGITSENMQKLFEPLFTTKAKGIGLGLAVSKKLVEANGGRIDVESEVGKGSTFTVYLPVQEDER